MSHTIQDKDKLIARVGRIRGQINAIEKALQNEDDCSEILQIAASSRGALNGLISELIEGHVMTHILDHHKRPTAEQTRAAKQLVDVVNTYLK